MVIWMLVAVAGGSWSYMDTESGLASTYAVGHALEAWFHGGEAFFYNPAVLYDLGGLEAAAGYGKHFGDLVQDFAGFMAVPFRQGGYGLHLLAYQTAEIERFSDFQEPQGTFRFLLAKALVGFGWRFSWRWGVGASMKVVYGQASPYSGAGVGLNVGSVFRPHEILALGFAVENLIPPAVRMNTERVSFPFTLRTGALLEPYPWLSWMASVVWPAGYDVNWGIGARFQPFSFFALAGGVDNRNVSAGAEVSYLMDPWVLDIQYAYSYPYGRRDVFEPSQRVSLKIHQIRFGVRAEATPGVVEEPGRELVRIRLLVSTRAPVRRWSMALRRSTGELVRVFEGTGDPPLQVEWDGRDQSGRVVPEGTYGYELVVEEITGQVHTARGKLVQFLALE